MERKELDSMTHDRLYNDYGQLLADLEARGGMRRLTDIPPVAG